MKLTSKELNEKIQQICDDDSLYEAFGGKSIPYIGWYWRSVNFDAKTYDFGVMLEGDYDYPLESNDSTQLGFMENNKWGYGYQSCPPDKWEEIKNLLEIAVTNTTRETLKAVNDKIQSLWIKNC